MSKTDPLLESRMANLARANDVRSHKAQLKKDLGRLAQHEAITLLSSRLVDDPESIGSLTVQQMLLSIDRIGRKKAMRIAMRARDTSMLMKIRDLPEFRRRALADALLDRVEHRAAA